MEQTKQTTKSPVVREYKIGDITYIVKAVVKDGVKEDAATKVWCGIKKVDSLFSRIS